MHHIYTSKSIILRRETQDKSAYFWILTRDFGLVKARAQGIRGTKSRLKGTLQEFSLATIAFVHGKNGWKITTAMPEENFCLNSPLPVRKVIAHIADVLIRFIVGEENSPKIFSTALAGFKKLSEEKKEDLKIISVIESLTLLRMLHLLGYVALDDSLAPLCADISYFSSPIISQALVLKKSIIARINKAFKESQL